MDLNSIVSEALNVLEHGGLMLYPTDTVWGIGCDATNEEAVQKVFALKRRSGAKSLVLLASDMDMIARFVRKIPTIAVDLVDVNDAPMTIVYPGAVVSPEGKPSRFALAPSTVAEDGSVGIRIPYTGDASLVMAAGSRRRAGSEDSAPANMGAEFCRQLVYKFRRPIVSTSANISGEPTPTCFADVSEAIRTGVDYVVPASCNLPLPEGKQGPNARFDDYSTGRSSQIIKLGVDGEVEIIRP